MSAKLTGWHSNLQVRKAIADPKTAFKMSRRHHVLTRKENMLRQETKTERQHRVRREVDGEAEKEEEEEEEEETNTRKEKV